MASSSTSEPSSSHGVLPGGDDGCALEGQWNFVVGHARNPDQTGYVGDASLRVEASSSLATAASAAHFSPHTRLLLGRCQVSAPFPVDTALIQPPPTASMRVVALTCGGGQFALARSLNEKFALSVLQPSGGESVLQGVYVFAKDKSIGVEKWLRRVDSADPTQQQQQQHSQAVAPGRYQVVLTKPKGKQIFPSGKETVAEVWVSVPRVEADWAVHSLMYREAASAALMPSTPPTYVGTLLWHAARALYVIERHQPSKAVPTLGLFGVESSPDGRSNTVSACWTNLIYFVPEQARILGMERWARIPAMSLAQHPKTLSIHVSGARNLTNAQTVGVSSPYFVMSLLRAPDGGAPIELYTSGVIKHSLSPNFDYTYEVALKKLAKKVGAVPSTLALGSGGIKLEILGHNRILKDDLLGELHLTWKQIDEAAAYGAHMDYPLRDGKGHTSGTVNLLISFSGRGKQDKHAPVADSAVVPGQFHQ